MRVMMVVIQFGRLAEAARPSVLRSSHRKRRFCLQGRLRPNQKRRPQANRRLLLGLGKVLFGRLAGESASASACLSAALAALIESVRFFVVVRCKLFAPKCRQQQQADCVRRLVLWLTKLQRGRIPWGPLELTQIEWARKTSSCSGSGSGSQSAG